MDLPKQKRAAQTKRAAPNGAARKLLISFSVTSTRRPNAGARGREIPLPRATLRSREREGKVFPAPALRIKRHARNTR